MSLPGVLNNRNYFLHSTSQPRSCPLLLHGLSFDFQFLQRVMFSLKCLQLLQISDVRFKWSLNDLLLLSDDHL